MISSIISFTFHVFHLPSVFQIISTKVLIRYTCDIPIHHKEKTGRVDPAELTRGRVDSGAELVPDRVDPLPLRPAFIVSHEPKQVRIILLWEAQNPIK